MKPFIWAHRGARTRAPENTLEAFELAIAQQADGIELDVHLSRDGEIVVAHDETLERVSDGHGRIIDKNLSELRSYNFSKVLPGYSPTQIPTLREVFERIAGTLLTVNVEIKSGLVLYEGIEEKLVALAREMKVQEQIVYSSFNHYSLLKLRSMDPSAKIGLLYSEALVDPQQYAHRIKADAIHPFYPTLQIPGIVEACKTLGIKVHPWTVNDPEALRAMVRLGVEAIITDVPDLAQKIVNEVNV